MPRYCHRKHLKSTKQSKIQWELIEVCIFDIAKPKGKNCILAGCNICRSSEFTFERSFYRSPFSIVSVLHFVHDQWRRDLYSPLYSPFVSPDALYFQ